jgi:hypothetical protein
VKQGITVGLKDWLVKNVAGASAYGEVMGRECVKNGIVLGRTLYLGHGFRTTPSDMYLFEDGEEMQSNGFELYCKDALNKPAMENSSELSLHTRAAGIALATQLTITAASNFIRSDANRRDFLRSLAPGTKTELTQLNSGITMERVLRFVNLPAPERVSKVLALEKPGTNDLLGVYLEELSKHTIKGSLGFQRTGILGFDLVAVPLVQETVQKIRAACEDFHW